LEEKEPRKREREKGISPRLSWGTPPSSPFRVIPLQNTSRGPPPKWFWEGRNLSKRLGLLKILGLGRRTPPPNRFGVDREPPLPPLTPSQRGVFFFKGERTFLNMKYESLSHANRIQNLLWNACFNRFSLFKVNTKGNLFQASLLPGRLEFWRFLKPYIFFPHEPNKGFRVKLGKKKCLSGVSTSPEKYSLTFFHLSL
jgi:hypothetical protein